MAVKSSLELLETHLVKHHSEIQARNIKWIILIPTEQPQQICETWLILTNISSETENILTPPHKIRLIKTSAYKKSNQLESLTSRSFLANSDPAPAYMQLYCVTKSELAVPHSFFSLPMCVIPTLSPKQICPQSHRMLVTHPRLPATEGVKHHFYPEVLWLFRWLPGEKSLYPLSFEYSWLTLHSENCSAFFFKKGFIEQARLLHVK